MTKRIRVRNRRGLTVAAVLLGVLAGAPAAGAHTETDLVALPAGESGAIVFRPTHGCGDAGTVEVAIRVPVEDATAGAVTGWEESAEPDGQGNTVLTWTGGLLAADAVGAFPVDFSVPDRVGELLVFPAVQTCENGDELAWIDGDPNSALPAPRILVLAPGSTPAASIDEVAADAPGRDLLVEVVDVDNPSGTTTTSTTSTTAPTTTTLPTTSITTDPSTTTVPTSPADGTQSAEAPNGGVGWVLPTVIVIGVVLVAGAVFTRRRA